MSHISKPYMYKLLSDISKEHNIDVSKYIVKLVGSDSIPYEAVVFVNKLVPLYQLSTYNAIFNKRNKSRLFRNIVKDDLSIEDKSIVLSSLLNQCLISIKHDKPDNRAELLNAVNIDIILSALNDYMFDNNEESVNTAFDMFRTIFKTLFPK